MRPKIFQVIPVHDYQVYIYFDDGRIKKYDAAPLVNKSGIFDRIKHIDEFISTCTIMNGTLAWDISGKRDPYNCIDICPDTLYYHCPDAKETDIPIFQTA